MIAFVEVGYTPLGMQSVIGGASATCPNLAKKADASFERIYQAWFGQVSRWALALGARQSDHEDLVQEIFTVVYRRLQTFNGNDVAGWLYQITRRKARDYRQLTWTRHVFFSETSSCFAAAELSAPGPLDELETKQKSEMLSRRLAKLPPEQRVAFMLFELEGLSGHEIAQQQQVPINTVWVRLFEARRKLKCGPRVAARPPAPRSAR